MGVSSIPSHCTFPLLRSYSPRVHLAALHANIHGNTLSSITYLGHSYSALRFELCTLAHCISPTTIIEWMDECFYNKKKKKIKIQQKVALRSHLEDWDYCQTIKAGLAKPTRLLIFEIYFYCSIGDGTKTLLGKSTTTELRLQTSFLLLFLLPQ